ncbi:GDP-mannose mannosyl hydrolase [Pseudoalteromonas sp. Isolate3]|uniref:GDP-mannose mannosyl hydrolase n=1 Tax=Pseudoalteromonas sp. Isolate3 TaxID=2908526 RepID=UPI001EFC7D6C|nr:GDP-mannose mannosyl hydrolase [Pseudoalteromonas sp. Isolate3]MCG9709922.1 GDP-mannose mannosyl hydrolase [Pseudoalteromonas sp. Isolate3]
MFLEQKRFQTVIDSAPLVSIDLVVLNENNEALLGQRLNRPAEGFWFVPGGRILKNESLANAFERLTLNELGIKVELSTAELLGPYDHFYDDSVFSDKIKTHYVAIAYVLRLTKQQLDALPLNEQHAAYKWFSFDELLKSPEVHKHTKWYFEALTK